MTCLLLTNYIVRTSINRIYTWDFFVQTVFFMIFKFTSMKSLTTRIWTVYSGTAVETIRSFITVSIDATCAVGMKKAKGDCILLIFCQTGICNWKKIRKIKYRKRMIISNGTIKLPMQDCFLETIICT